MYSVPFLRLERKLEGGLGLAQIFSQPLRYSICVNSLTVDILNHHQITCGMKKNQRDD